MWPVGSERLRSPDIGAVVGDAHFSERTANERADENAEGAENGPETEFSSKLHYFLSATTARFKEDGEQILVDLIVPFR